MFFLDESGFGLSLPPTYAWARKGEAVRVPRAWGKSGRVNAVAHLERRSCGGWALGYALLERRCETVAYPSRYSPHLNPVERIWRRVKGFLMPRRRYRSVEELRGAVAVAMERLREQMGQGVLQGLCIGTQEAIHGLLVHPRLAQGRVGEVGVLPIGHHEVHP